MFVNEVNRVGRLLPPQEAIIVLPEETEAQYEGPKRAPNELWTVQPINWQRRQSTWNYDQYEGLVGDYPHAVPASTEPVTDSWDLAGLKVPWLLPYAVTKDHVVIDRWKHAYLLDRLSDRQAVYYLSLIDEDDALYPESVHGFLERLLGSKLMPPIEVIAPQMGLYIPRELRSASDEFFLHSIYWLRYLRPSRNALGSILERMSLIDLYLVTANPYEHYPARKLLSYYTDEELYQKFGRIGNYFFPKQYTSKRQQSDALVAFSLFRFGYFTIKRGSRPVELLYNRPRTPILSPNEIYTESYTLKKLTDALSQQELLMPILRLSVQLASSRPWLSDPEAWEPFFRTIELHGNILQQKYLQESDNPYYYSSTHTEELKIPPDFKSLESSQHKCLLCRQNRPETEFPLCGHPSCSSCQVLLKSDKCPFCNEHFVTDNLDDGYVSALKSNIPSRVSLHPRIIEVQEQARQRALRFDWANSDVRLSQGLPEI